MHRKLRYDSSLSSRISLFLRCGIAQFRVAEKDESKIHDLVMDILSLVAILRPIRYQAVVRHSTSSDTLYDVVHVS
jgi:hypothetical protein